MALAGRIHDQEVRLKQLLKEPNTDGKTLNTVRISLRDKYAAIIQEDFAHAVRIKAESNLWKFAFYSSVQEYQKKFTRCSASRLDPAKKERGEQLYKQLVRELEKFIRDASVFYRSLTASLLAACNVEFDGYTTGAPTKVKGAVEGEVRGHMIEACYRCIIYLGDLERYLQRHCRENAQDFSDAAEHYRAAGRILPSGSNHCNQLGVLADSAGDHLTALYFYVRSHLVAGETKFVQAMANIGTVFKKTDAWRAQEEERESPQLASARAKPWASAGAHEQERRVRNLSLKFCRLQSMLFHGGDLERFNTIEQPFFTDLCVHPAPHARSVSPGLTFPSRTGCLCWTLGPSVARPSQRWPRYAFGPVATPIRAQRTGPPESSA